MLRKGRFDNLFFVDLPDERERAAIWAIQIAKYKRDPERFDLKALAWDSDGLTGAEIEQVVIEALYQCFADNREVDQASVEAGLAGSVPLATTMAERIGTLREWARTRASAATTRIDGRGGIGKRRIMSGVEGGIEWGRMGNKKGCSRLDRLFLGGCGRALREWQNTETEHYCR